MKKTVIVLAALIVFASSSFAGVSFLTAPGVGTGNWVAQGVYETNHDGAIGNTDDPTVFDSTSVGVRGEYGVMKDLDVLVGYTSDTFPNIKRIDAAETGIQTSGYSVDVGVKYSLGKLLGCDTAVMGGCRSISLGIKEDAVGNSNDLETELSIGYILSMQMNNLTPYGGVFYRRLTENAGKIFGTSVDPFTEIGLAFNIGCKIGIASNQSILVEYNTENQEWSEEIRHGVTLDDKSSINVSGISLAYEYDF